MAFQDRVLCSSALLVRDRVYWEMVSIGDGQRGEIRDRQVLDFEEEFMAFLDEFLSCWVVLDVEQGSVSHGVLASSRWNM
jgi:hypothetical protein